MKSARWLLFASKLLGVIKIQKNNSKYGHKSGVHGHTTVGIHIQMIITTITKNGNKQGQILMLYKTR